MASCCCGRLRLFGVMKAFTLFSLGFILRSLLDLSLLNNMIECPACPSCDNVVGDDLLQSDIHLQLREPYKPRTMYEVIRYDYFNMSAIMNNFDDNPKTGLLGHQKSDIKDILYEAMVMFNSGASNRWKMSKLVNGYRRYDPLRGEEYVLDLLLEPENEEFESSDSTLHRLELVKPYGTSQLISQHKIIARDKMIHFVLPVTASNPKLEQFLANFEELCIKIESEMFALLIIFVNPKAVNPEARVHTIKEMASRISKKHHNAHISVVQTRKPFSRALGLDLGAKQLPQNALMFFSDADVLVSPGFVTRCKENTALNKQVYYPIVFAQYDPQIVENYSPKEKYRDFFSINKHTGHWVHYGFGMACMYAADYRSVGGLDLKIRGWGGEDVDLYKKHAKSSLKVFRATDPGLIHVYHPKSCDRNLTAEQLKMCQNSRAEGRGSRLQLGRILSDYNVQV